MFRYRFDTFMAKGGRSIFISLVLVFVAILISITALRVIEVAVLPKKEEGQYRRYDPGHQAYITFLQMTDPGNMAQDIESSPWYKVPAVLAGLAGVVMLSVLIAFITTALDRMLTELRKGHSKVLEEGHTLVLGWEDQRILEILRELIEANDSEDDPCVVILSPKDKEDMDDFLALHMPDTGNTRIVTRTGSVSSLVNLKVVSVGESKAVIALGECSETAGAEVKAASDAKMIKTVLAVIASRPEEAEMNIVVEIFNARNRRIVEDISPGEISTVDAHDILAKILVQTSRSRGLSIVYSEILSFDGCEMYFHNDDWGGSTFGDVGYHFPDGVPMGIRSADGEILLNPPVTRVLLDDDDLLILAEDDSTIHYQPKPVAVPRDMKLAGGRKDRTLERELMLGWSSKAEIILQEYAEYVLPGSKIDIVLRRPSDAVRARIAELDAELEGLEIKLYDADPLKGDVLLNMEPFKYNNIIILSQFAEGADSDRTDSETIIILLLLRSIFADNPGAAESTQLITEVLDSENQSLVARAGVNDFIISTRYVSMLLAQMSESRDIKVVYDHLFEEDGSEIYLKPASLYFKSFPVDVTYADMMAVAQQREEVCLGVKRTKLERDMERNFGVKLIPEKTESYTLLADDCLVVLSEDET